LSIERNLIISLLKLTKNYSTSTTHLKDDAKLPQETTYAIIEKLQSEDLLNLNTDVIEVSVDDRLRLAVKVISLGADIELVSNLLCWQEFEEITAMALRSSGFTVYKNVRFKTVARKWEIDIIGCKRPIVVCIDCKHWGHAISPSALKKIVEAQANRAEALSDVLPNPKIQLECVKWERAHFTPTILSLTPNSFKFYNNIPIVPILQLQDFLNQLPAYRHQLKTYPKIFDHIC
jgi:Holliday junction resolvase-like predicted endonuclease